VRYFVLMVVLARSLSFAGGLDELPLVTDARVEKGTLTEEKLGLAIDAPDGWRWRSLDDEGYACTGTGYNDWFLLLVVSEAVMSTAEHQFARGEEPTLTELLEIDRRHALAGVLADEMFEELPVTMTFWEGDEVIMAVAPLDGAGEIDEQVLDALLGARDISGSGGISSLIRFRFIGYLLIWLVCAALAKLCRAIPNGPLFNEHRLALALGALYWVYTMVGVVQNELGPYWMGRATITALILLPAMYKTSKGTEDKLDALRAKRQVLTLAELKALAEDSPEDRRALENYWDRALKEGKGYEVTSAANNYIRAVLAAGDLEEALRARAEYLEAYPQGKLPSSLLFHMAEHATGAGDDRARAELLGELGAREETLNDQQKQRLARLEGRETLGSPEQTPTRVRDLKLIEARLTGVSGEGLTISRNGGPAKRLAFSRIVGIAGGVVPNADRSAVLIMDLILDDLASVAKGNRVIRLDSRTTDLRTIFPGVATREAWSRLARGLLAKTGAIPYPDRDAVIGRKHARFPGTEAYERAIYSLKRDSELMEAMIA